MTRRDNTFWIDGDGNIRIECNVMPKELGIQQSDTFAAMILEGELVLVKIDLELKER